MTSSPRTGPPRTGPRTYRCEWPTPCPHKATTNIRRSLHDKPMHMCPTHARMFHDLTNPEAADISAHRQPVHATPRR